jgi:hypothetical protein
MARSLQSLRIFAMSFGSGRRTAAAPAARLAGVGVVVALTRGVRVAAVGRPPQSAFPPRVGLTYLAAKLLYHARFQGANAKNGRLARRKRLPGFFETFV